MGNCCAKQGNPLDVLRDLAPAPRPHSSDSVLSERVIRTGLGKVADELHAKGKQITIVGVGGVISTLLLKSRPQTGDVDFFYNTKQKSEDVSAIVAAAKLAAKTLRTGEAWLNNHTVLFIQVCLVLSLSITFTFLSNSSNRRNKLAPYTPSQSHRMLSSSRKLVLGW